MVHTTLVRMARGGMYDQLGGGFARYSVDAHWLVPHFEKMLYDNAQLASLYLHAWLAFGDPECRRVCEETLDYLLREMTDPAGGFYSAAGRRLRGPRGQVLRVDGGRDPRRARRRRRRARWRTGVWIAAPTSRARAILYLAGEPDPEAHRPAAPPAARGARAKRVRPGRDDKVLAGWNGLACRALAEAGRALGRSDYVAAAVRNAEFLLDSMRRDGRLLRTWKAGQARLKGYLEDYAMVAAALVDVYEATFERRWLDAARGLADDLLGLFWDEALEGFYDTGHDHERLIVRPRNLFDNAVPSGTSVAIETLLRLAVLTGEATYESRALAALRPVADLIGRYPSGFGRFLCALDFHLGPRVEVALVTPPRAGGAESLAAEVFGRYLPNRVVVGMAAGDGPAAAGIPLLEGRGAVEGKATAYVCRNYACELPVTDRAALASQLDAL